MKVQGEGNRPQNIVYLCAVSASLRASQLSLFVQRLSEFMAICNAWWGRTGVLSGNLKGSNLF